MEEFGKVMQAICNVIVLLGGVAGAITGILALCGRPLKFLKKRREKAEQARREEIISDMSGLIKKQIKPELENIQQQNLEQSEDIRVLTETMRDSIGAEIMAFYEAHRATRTITESEKDAVEDLYKSYKAIKGNHYVDKVYERMTVWTVVDENGHKVEGVRWWKPPKEENK